MAVNPNFELLTAVTIPEINTHARLLRHRATGAQVLSLENNDENKVFGITFRTPPTDSTGIAHIMEHSVLCGSRKYPVKEPFVELIKGSIKTFLNAFTYPDKTCYPVASTNTQDFYNLMDVYLDAVFYPRITPEILMQEGWHYELEDPAAPLAYKGVVFNEMKGAYSSPEGLLGRYSQQVIFPDTTYGVDSGGDPQEIPNLTYAAFKKFHQTYYHPSNSRIFFYGDDDPDRRLELLQAYLQDFEYSPVASEVELQPPFEQPRRVTYPYDAGDEAVARQKSYLTVNWLLPENADTTLSLSLAALAYILVGTPASPLRKALIDSGLGENMAGGGLEDELRQLLFSTGLKNINAANAEAVERLILDTLAALVEHGLESDMIEAALNTFEFRLRENNTGSFPRGLSLMLHALTTWLYGGDPLAPLAFEAPLAAIRQNLAANPRYFEGLIDRHLLQNQHRVTLRLEPDGTLRRQEDAAEAARLAAVKAQLSQADLQQVIADTQKLKAMQAAPDSPEALATIPCLALSDLDRQGKIIPLAVFDQAGSRVLYHDLFTNGIVYLDAGFNLHALPQDLLPYVPLFGQSLVKIGTDKEDFVKLSQRIGRKTGGIWPSTFISAVRHRAEGELWLFLRGKATLAQTDDMLAIMRDVLLSLKLDNRDRFKQMVLETKASVESGLIPGGHGVVNARLRANFNEADWVEEQMGGVSYLFFLRQLAQDVERNWPAVLEKLESIRRILINQNAMLVNVTVNADGWQQFQPKLTEFIAAMPAQPFSLARWTPGPAFGPEGLTIPAQVNYVGKGANLYNLGYNLHGSHLAITNFLRTTWLWERVRVQGGAYGGFCQFDTHSGVFSYLSYRDPNLLDTLANYDDASRFLRDVHLSADDVTKSIIGGISALDSYQLPDAKGYTSMVRYLLGVSEEERQQRREQLLSTTPADFRDFAEVLARVNERGLVVVLGAKEAIEQANAARGNWLNVKKVL